MKKIMLYIFAMLLIIVGFSACTPGMDASADAPNTVHMDETSFLKIAITIKKGEVVTLVNDSYTATHPLKNGIWKDGKAEEKREADAPTIDVTVSTRETKSIGPFNTAGIFQVYCTIHQGMYLTIHVR